MKTRWVLVGVLLLGVALGGVMVMRQDLTRAEEEFLYLAGVLSDVTEGAGTQTEKLRAMTEWLSVNVKKVPKYPEWFDGSSAARVIQGGIGNCGYQANNIIVFAKMLQVEGIRRYWLGPESGSTYQHAFAEIRADGRWGVFDPNLLGYVAIGNDRVASLRRMVREPSLVQEPGFRKIIDEIRQHPWVIVRTYYPEPPLPLGPESYRYYETYGEIPLRAYFAVRGILAQARWPALAAGPEGRVLTGAAASAA